MSWIVLGSLALMAIGAIIWGYHAVKAAGNQESSNVHRLRP